MDYLAWALWALVAWAAWNLWAKWCWVRRIRDTQRRKMNQLKDSP